MSSGRSSIERLPEALRAALNDYLKTPGVSVDDATHRINESLTEMGHATVSRSAVGRHRKRIHKIGERVRQAQEIVESWGKHLSEDDGQLTGAMVHTLRAVIFDMVLAQDAEEGAEITISPQDAAHLTRAVKQLEETADIGLKRVARLQEQAVRAAAERAEASVKAAGLSPEATIAMRNAILEAL